MHCQFTAGKYSILRTSKGNQKRSTDVTYGTMSTVNNTRLKRPWWLSHLACKKYRADLQHPPRAHPLSNNKVVESVAPRPSRLSSETWRASSLLKTDLQCSDMTVHQDQENNLRAMWAYCCSMELFSAPYKSTSSSRSNSVSDYLVNLPTLRLDYKKPHEVIFNF